MAGIHGQSREQPRVAGWAGEAGEVFRSAGQEWEDECALVLESVRTHTDVRTFRRLKAEVLPGKGVMLQ